MKMVGADRLTTLHLKKDWIVPKSASKKSVFILTFLHPVCSLSLYSVFSCVSFHLCLGGLLNCTLFIIFKHTLKFLVSYMWLLILMCGLWYMSLNSLNFLIHLQEVPGTSQNRNHYFCVLLLLYKGIFIGHVLTYTFEDSYLIGVCE